MRYSHRLRLPLKYFNIFIAVLTFVLFIWLTPVVAQALTKAPVILDGQEIFKISDSGHYSAQERTNLINSQLKYAIKTSEFIQVKIEERNQLPTILLNGRYLLTVTEQDTVPGSTVDEQARIWGQEIEEALQQARLERTKTYLQHTTFVAVAILLITAGFTWLLGWINHHFFRVASQRLTTPNNEIPNSELLKVLELFFKLVLASMRIALWISTILYITNLFPFTRQWSYQISNILITSFTSPILTLGKNPYSLTELIILIGLLFGLVIFAGTLTNFLRSRILSFTGINRGAQEAIVILFKYGLIFIGTLVLLQIWGLDISSLTILASALSVGIGFGLQDIAKNFGSGLVLVFERPIQVGDFVEVGEYTGTVERIGGRSTEIRTLDHVSIIVPNSRFLEKEVINWSHRNPISRLHLPVSVAYSSDPKVVQAALLEAASKHPNVLEVPSPLVLFKELGNNSLNFELLVWTAEPNKQFLLKSDLYYNIYESLQQRQIEIPFPQLDLHLRSGTLEFTPEMQLALIQMFERLSNHQQRIDPIKPSQSNS
ncbi:mechanosensitive ion channel family protein [Nostoc sphaeroides]|uniref:Mechanosensitive ion channel protein MscS n=1 Tax=Nostoc sphaeroides CCNUC1 TaxID=2653204 RepID=A0A5P8W9L6_9NOSO|nr:mechanosensitive ion channel domain-containing protein [Nostoc sphaeroides]MCC5627469.1 mechanosensitive ion channel [Nostoc sphaeroides CHAB 2801]QFS49360.1 mechanosensitive ion channel protein MscS [Nostoc sphaeroides CCNUC1]